MPTTVGTTVGATPHRPTPAKTPGPRDFATPCTCGKWLIRVERKTGTHWRHGPRQ